MHGQTNMKHTIKTDSLVLLIYLLIIGLFYIDVSNLIL